MMSNEEKVVVGNPATTTMPVPDYNQNNERKADYIKNRPFYDSIIETENETVVLSFDGDGDFVDISRGSALGLIPNEEYTLSFRGYKDGVFKEEYCPNPNTCIAEQRNNYVLLDLRDNDDWKITILDTTSSYAMDDVFAGELSPKLFPYLATWFESECDSYGVVIKGNFSRVESRRIGIRHIDVKSLLKIMEEQPILAAPLLISPSGEKVFRLVVNEDGAVSTEDVTQEVRQ